MVEKRRRLARADWITAALTALTEKGVAAVAIEPLAAQLGATKGSAYWHFSNRDELLRAALERWEHDETDAIIEVVDHESDPIARLRALLTAAFMQPKGNLAVVLSGTNDPLVEPVLTRVTERRIAYLAKLFELLDFAESEARHRAVLVYSAYLGNAHLWRTVPSTLPSNPEDWQRYMDDTLRIFTS